MNEEKTKIRVETDKVLEIGIDYYIEGESFVFTEYYLKGRGYCCKRDCRHCPYGSNNKSE